MIVFTVQARDCAVAGVFSTEEKAEEYMSQSKYSYESEDLQEHLIDERINNDE